MKNASMNKYLLLVVFITFLFIIFYSSYNSKDGFSNGVMNKYNIDIPLTTNIQCNNICGPPGRCSITGEDCSTDSGCYGCKPLKNSNYHNKSAIPDTSAGKLSFNSNNYAYSSLTTDITHQKQLIGPKFSPAPRYFQGVNTWRKSFDAGNQLFDNRYNPDLSYKNQNIMPYYPINTTLSNEFTDVGPTAANAWL